MTGYVSGARSNTVASGGRLTGLADGADVFVTVVPPGSDGDPSQTSWTRSAGVGSTICIGEGLILGVRSNVSRRLTGGNNGLMQMMIDRQVW